LGRALNRTFFQFARTETTYRPPSYHALGRRAVVKAVWDVDRRLSEVGSGIDLLLLASPVNTEGAWSFFRRAHYDREPVLLYRPLPFNPPDLKRSLWSIPIGKVEDPTLELLFSDQRMYLDRQITMLRNRETSSFLHDSLALYGDVGPDLVGLAQSVLERVPPRREGGRGRRVSAAEFAATAQAELAHYRSLAPDLASTVELRDDVSTLMVSRGNLLVGSRLSFPVARVNPLIHHEVGTHVVTHHNGTRQPFHLLASGLAGYEALQEGLAVLSEYLVGGLDSNRLRIIAARGLAARSVADGAAFIDTFRLLTQQWGLGKRAAFNVAVRVHRSGGFVKDAVYLRGLSDVLEHLGRGGDPVVLTSGKVALEHVPVLIELQRREVLRAPELSPRYLEDARAQARLQRCRNGLSVRELVEEVLH
jgi:uncharacterized protein (TIGR02421 family)